ncbi:HD domain-containing protein [Nocardia farcinica]|uniref:HD domain protein, cyanamide hydratase family n=2 Tax=Nocardia TaxID=1817 RepID=A0A0H5NLZ5_NOCFR|nr:HD domain-containing protein [Nocardia farcinica]AXK85090.1 HD domain-containing protein [Nocardia farcinica]MBA4855500.1 HD domain-containing protein [Nocardia farcinica]MBC9818161.1 HD domain-containing protein [Nocardia farcinica]CRY76197.1 HD domain protein%2C cyanamide hydratase family [Nocardia farcinica]SIS74725.1 HD domain-containing protein [Nocardia farcinica]
MSLSRRAALGASAAVLASAAVAAADAHQPVAPDDPLAVPTTPLARRATELIDAELPAHLRNHSVRGFLFARAVAATRGMRPGHDYDEELMYLISALHDIGLAEIANGSQRFEFDGADYAAEFLERNGVTDERVDVVWDAIAWHTTGFGDSPVYRRRRRPEMWITVEGIGIDVAGGPADLPPGLADRVHERYPRLGGSRALTEAIERQALADPRKAPPATLPGEIVHQRHPHLPYLTWDMILASSGWRD